MIHSIRSLGLQWGIQGNSLYKRISYQILTRKLFRIRNGVFSDVPLKKLKQDDIMSLVAQSERPGYLSFETILTISGINSQYTDTWYVATPKHSRHALIESLDIDIMLQHLPEEIFYNQLGIIHEDGYSRASRERAIADTLGRSPLYHFDVIPGDLDLVLLTSIGELWKDISPKAYTRIMKICLSLGNL